MDEDKTTTNEGETVNIEASKTEGEVIINSPDVILSNIKENTDENIENKEIEKSKVNKLGNPSWKKGQSGNPNGRPKGTFSFIPLLKNALKDIYKNTDKSNAKVVVEKLIKNAIEKEDIRAMKELMDRVDGTPAQTIKGDKDAPIFKIVVK